MADRVKWGSPPSGSSQDIRTPAQIRTITACVTRFWSRQDLGRSRGTPVPSDRSSRRIRKASSSSTPTTAAAISSQNSPSPGRACSS